MKTFFILILTISIVTFAQHSVPFASQNNTIELSVANTSAISTSNVVVTVTSAPSWLRIENRKMNIDNLRAKEMQAATFQFSVDKSAPVNKPADVTFTISNAQGETWSKTLSLQVSPPEKFEVFQNYPNPFNPSTTISYLLPVASMVSVKIYDMLGREVATLVNNGLEEPGYHQWIWNASYVASGVYIYQVFVKTYDNKKEVVRKKMLLVK